MLKARVLYWVGGDSFAENLSVISQLSTKTSKLSQCLRTTLRRLKLLKKNFCMGGGMPPDLPR